MHKGIVWDAKRLNIQSLYVLVHSSWSGVGSQTGPKTVTRVTRGLCMVRCTPHLRKVHRTPPVHRAEAKALQIIRDGEHRRRPGERGSRDVR